MEKKFAKKVKKSVKKSVKKKKRKPRARKDPSLVLSAKVSTKMLKRDYQSMVSLAKRYAKGSLSVWLRNASLKYRPRKGEKLLTRPSLK